MALREVFNTESTFIMSRSGRTLILAELDGNGKGYVKIERDGLLVNRVDVEKELGSRYPSDEELLQEELKEEELRSLPVLEEEEPPEPSRKGMRKVLAKDI